MAERIVNVSGVAPDQAMLARSERLVATFVSTVAKAGSPEMALGAAIALQCFIDPAGVDLLLEDDTEEEANAIHEVASEGQRQVKDILDAWQIMSRVSELADWMSDGELEVLMDRTLGGGAASRTEALRAVEAAVMLEMLQ